MGSGKTTVGKRLALLLEYDFLDLDAYIESQEQTTITALFEKKGEPYFRERESHYLKQLDKDGNRVIATGGGTPCFFDNMKYMNATGITVYLKAAPRLLAYRLRQQQDHRPLLKGKSQEEVMAFITEKLAERESFYNTARVIVKAASLNANQLSQLLRQSGLI